MARRTKRPPASHILPTAEWRSLSIGEKIEHLLGYSLDDAYVVAKWPVNDCTPAQLSIKMTQMSILVRNGMQMALAAYKDRISAEQLKVVEQQIKEALAEVKERG